MPAAGAIRRGHSPEWPGRATAASRRCTTPRWRIGRPAATAAAAPARPQPASAASGASGASGALQPYEALEPAPFVPQRLGLDLLEAPKPPTARPRVVAAACALPAARLPGAEAERSQQIALRAPDQLGARTRRTRQPLFEREPPRKAALAYGLPPRRGQMSFVLLRHAPIRSRDAAFAPEFCRRQEKPSQEAFPRNSSLERREAERREAHHRAASRKRCGARPLSCLPTAGGLRSPGPQKMERARSPFGAPPRHPRSFGPRLGLGRASWNHRMQTGGPSPAPVQRAPRGPTRAGRDDAQAARERSVSLRPTRTAPAPP